MIYFCADNFIIVKILLVLILGTTGIFSKMLSSNFEGKKGWFIMVNGFMQADTPNPWHSLKNPTLAGRL